MKKVICLVCDAFMALTFIWLIFRVTWLEERVDWDEKFSRYDSERIDELEKSVERLEDKQFESEMGALDRFIEEHDKEV